MKGGNFMFTNTFYGLTDDLVFKHVFSYKFILIDFLNSYFQFTKQAKKVLRVRINTNAPINGNKRKYKIYYGDILAYLDNGEIISLEMYTLCEASHNVYYEKKKIMRSCNLNP